MLHNYHHKKSPKRLIIQRFNFNLQLWAFPQTLSVRKQNQENGVLAFQLLKV